MGVMLTKIYFGDGSEKSDGLWEWCPFTKGRDLLGTREGVMLTKMRQKWPRLGRNLVIIINAICFKWGLVDWGQLLTMTTTADEAKSVNQNHQKAANLILYQL